MAGRRRVESELSLKQRAKILELIEHGYDDTALSARYGLPVASIRVVVAEVRAAKARIKATDYDAEYRAWLTEGQTI